MKTILLGEAILQFLKQGRVELLWAEHTVRGYEIKLRLLHRYFGNMPVHQITPADVRAWRQWIASKPCQRRRGEPIGEVSLYHYSNAARVFWNYLHTQGYAVFDPEQILLRKPKMPERRFLNETDLLRLLEAPSMTCKTGIRNRAILEVMFSTGMRLSELCQVDRQDVNFSLNPAEITIRGKGGKQRVVFLSPRAVRYLQLWLKRHPDTCEALFTTVYGDEPQRMSLRALHNAVKKCARRAGLEMSAHTMRHTFSTYMLNHGVDLYALMKMLGHAQLTTTQVYLHVTNPSLREMHKKGMVLD
ncbi:MAG: hypothetical protein COT71_02085 [Candidatus Andersenbacteria bacterium CG10_big_fil_rev_8_21_14_0_10_54_11]|uniref:Integrase n=1 Tax=Candidatus Andersenbacteria bacterium CG10_big_fil_rev_8_21_14_0_10_54_11 TaxID=1974485 RepID=A0A2M6WZE7_9BACT|nr:MAG: hypothetical protein COT71_02085 [Candidatus Andersenbacteria bacterium CG10_big_fil_rev_8_21_14_0_10_54_11]